MCIQEKLANKSAENWKCISKLRKHGSTYSIIYYMNTI